MTAAVRQSTDGEANQRNAASAAAHAAHVRASLDGEDAPSFQIPSLPVNMRTSDTGQQPPGQPQPPPQPPPQPQPPRSRTSVQESSDHPSFLPVNKKLSDGQLEYFKTTVRPLLEILAESTLDEMPAKLPGFLIKWLLNHVKVPHSIADPVVTWLKVSKKHSVSTKEVDGATPATAAPDEPPSFEAPQLRTETPFPPSNFKSEVSEDAEEQDDAGSNRPSVIRPESRTGAEGRVSGAGAEGRPESRNGAEETKEEPQRKSQMTQGQMNRLPSIMKRPGSKMGQVNVGGACQERGSNAGQVPVGGACQERGSNAQSHPQVHAHVQVVDTPEKGRKGRSSSSITSGNKEANDAQKAMMKRKVSIVVTAGQQSNFNSLKRDSFGICKHRMKRGRAVSIFVPPPQVSPAQVMDLLRNVPLFKKLCEEDLEILAHYARIRAFDSDEEVVRYGEKYSDFFVVYSGQARVSIPTVQSILRVGDCFGENALMRSHVNAASTVSANGGDAQNLITLALSQKDMEDSGLLTKVVKASGGEKNFIKRTGTAAAWRMGRRCTPCDATALKAVQDRLAKTEDDRKLITRALQANAHFQDWLSMSEQQFEAMTDMFRIITVEAGRNVITKGEMGNTFFIVNDGVLELITDEESGIPISSLRVGDSFGELALLYNCGRKATVRATRQCQLWVLTRNDYRSVMRLKTEAREAEYERLINMVPLLQERLSEEEKTLLAGALEEAFFVKGEEIVHQGDEGSCFYIVFDGNCEVLVNGESCAFLKKGEYFGERALLTSEPRAATITCASETATLLALDGQSFTLLLGNLLTDKPRGEDEDTVSPLVDGRRPSMPTRGRHDSVLPLLDAMLTQKGQEPKSELIPREDLYAVGALGYGAFGIVTLQRHKTTQKMYALKALSKGFIKREGLQEQVISEKKTLQMLDTEFVVSLFCTYRCDQYIYLLLEPALGGELYCLYDQNQHFFGSEAHARFYSVCACLGLEHLHARKIIYRDLKMENLLLNKEGYVILTDLGLAKIVLGKTFTVCGTADYFAPETLRQVGHNRAVDWWALGILIFIMMAGRSPFDADNVMQIYKNIVKGFKKEHFPDTFSPDLCNLIKGICRKKPEERLPMAPGGSKNLEMHNWYKELSFQEVERHVVKAPYLPPEPDFDVLKERLDAGPPQEVEFVHNQPETDQGWDDEFAN